MAQTRSQIALRIAQAQAEARRPYADKIKLLSEAAQLAVDALSPPRNAEEEAALSLLLAALGKAERTN